MRFTLNSLHGIIPPMCTPFTAEGEIDLDSVPRLVEFLIGHGVHGIFVLGSTGEFPVLTNSQRQTVIEATVAAVNGRVPVLAGIVDTSTRRCIENGKVAQAAGADGVVLAPPYYYRHSQAELLDFFHGVRQGFDIPLIAYNIVVAGGVKLEVNTIATLAADGTIGAIKDSTGDLTSFREIIIATRNSGLRIFTGSELIVDTCLSMGAHGSVPGLGNVLPGEYVKLYDVCMQRDYAAAASIQDRLIPFFFALIGQGAEGWSVTSAALAGFKVGLKAQGIITNARMADPLHPMSAAVEEKIVQVMRRFQYLPT